jgi:hypothetical protein
MHANRGMLEALGDGTAWCDRWSHRQGLRPRLLNGVGQQGLRPDFSHRSDLAMLRAKRKLSSCGSKQTTQGQPYNNSGPKALDPEVLNVK